MSRLSELEAALERLMGSWTYAYAMGSCSNGGKAHPRLAEVRERAAELRYQIADERWLNDFGATDRETW